MSYRQPDLFYADKVPPRAAPPVRAYRQAAPKHRAAAFTWTSMATWVRHMNRLFALERASGEHYSRVRQTARLLTVERIHACRHGDDLERVERMILEANAGWLGGGLSTAFDRAERGTLLVEVRNRRHLLALGRDHPKPKGSRFDLTLLPIEALERLIQTHRDIAIVDKLRAERLRRSSTPTKDTPQ